MKSVPVLNLMEILKRQNIYPMGYMYAMHIYLHLVDFLMVNVDRQIYYMDPMGINKQLPRNFPS